MDPDYKVEGFPFTFSINYSNLLNMCGYFVDKIKAETLDNNKEEPNGFKLYSKK